MARKPSNEELQRDHLGFDSEMLKAAGIDPGQRLELAHKLADLGEQKRLEKVEGGRILAEQMLAVWAPHVPSILNSLRKKGLNIDSLRESMEAATADPSDAAQRDRLAKAFEEQRALILDAISEAAELGHLERQVRAVISSAGQGGLAFDSVLAVTARKEG